MCSTEDEDQEKPAAAGPESAKADPPTTLQLKGGEFTSVADRPRTWTYRPTEVSLAENAAGGGRQLGLIEAGSFAMLSLTLQLAIAPDVLETARRILAERDDCPPAEIDLIPAPMDVGPVTLLLGDGGSDFSSLATATSAGSPPYSAIFSVTLDPGQLAGVKKALQGEHGRLAARYEVTVRTPRQSTVSTEEATFQETSQTFTTTTTSHPPDVSQPDDGGVQSSAESHTWTSTTHTGGFDETAAESSDPVQPAPEIVQTDAADWNLDSN